MMIVNLSGRAKVLIGVAAACLGYVVLVPDTSQTIEPVRGGSAAPRVERSGSAAGDRPARLLPVSLLHSGRIVDGATPGALFAAHSWYVAPPPPPAPAAPLQAPPPPAAPPLPYAFMGSYRTEGKATYFLTAGERVYDVKIGDTLDNTYSVDGVSAGQLRLTYLPLKIQQTLTVGEE